jgi:hypothetical protein
LLTESLPFHNLRCGSTAEVCTEVVTAPLTGLVLAVTLLGLGVWWWRRRLAWVSGHLQWLTLAARAEFGFDWVNGRVSTLTRSAAQAISVIQTGQLGWNMMGIVGTLIIILAILVWGA